MNGASLGNYFTESFLFRKEKMAIVFLRDGKIETEMSYSKLNTDTNRMANTFSSMGIDKGDRVVLFMKKSLFFVVAYLALQKIGAVSIPLNPEYTETEMAYFLKDADAKRIVLERESESLIQKIDPDIATLAVDSKQPYQAIDIFQPASKAFAPADIHPDDPSLMIYTSGTTSQPKGVVLTQKNLVHDAENIIQVWGIDNRDVLCHALPLFHVHGLCFALHTALLTGACLLMHDQFNPRIVMATLANATEPNKCTIFMAVPAMYAKLMEAIGGRKHGFGHIRLWTSGSAPLLAKDFDRIRRVFGKEPVEREGMSETGMNFSNPLHGTRKPGSIGLPLPGLGVRIVDPKTGADVTTGQRGEIWLKGDSITPGYWRKPEETAGAFEKGWFKTGDIGCVDADGYYYLTDRIKHIIISGGENISPKEVEIVIIQVEGVREVAVVGIPDEKWGEKVVAAVVPEPGADILSDEIDAICQTHLHKWKCPKKIVFVNALPRNTMGKVLVEEVKKLF